MDMTGEYRIPAPREKVWDALNDPEILKKCIPGCQELNKDEASALADSADGLLDAQVEWVTEQFRAMGRQDAEDLGLQKGQPVTYQTANGPIRAWQTVVDEIRLGELRVGRVRASINPNDTTPGILLGMSFLKHLDFSQQGNTLTLSYPQTR